MPGLVPGRLTNRLALRTRSPRREEGEEVGDVDGAAFVDVLRARCATGSPLAEQGEKIRHVDIAILADVGRTWQRAEKTCAGGSNPLEGSRGKVAIYDIADISTRAVLQAAGPGGKAYEGCAVGCEALPETAGQAAIEVRQVKAPSAGG